jgi:hybrid cluster-associated redox disulfide protein
MDNQTTTGHLEAPIEVILEKWPKISRIFISNRMGCIGCSFAKFHTLYDACEIYQLDKGYILGQIQDLLKMKEG